MNWVMRYFPIFAYFIALMIPLIDLQTFWDISGEKFNEDSRLWQYISLVLIMSIAIFLRDRRLFKINQTGLMHSVPFVAWAFLSSLWSISPLQSFLNALLLVGFGWFFSILWTLNDREFKRYCFFSIIGIIAGLIILFARLPINGRTLGYISPTLIGHYSFAVAVLSMLWGKYRKSLAIFSLFVIIFSQSRNVAIEYLLFYTIYFSHKIIVGNARSRSGMITLVGGIYAIAVGIYLFALSSFIEAVSSVVGVDTQSRLGDDFTGRGEIWDEAFKLIENSPFVGFGFRTRGNADLDYITDTLNAHSGVLNIILDTGFIGLVFFLLAYAYAIGRSYSAVSDEGFERRRVAAALLTAVIPVLFIEPTYISFGSPVSYLAILAISFGYVDFVRDISKAKSAKRRRQLQQIRVG